MDVKGEVRILAGCYILKQCFLSKKLRMFFVCFDVLMLKIGHFCVEKSLARNFYNVGEVFIYIEKYFEIQSGSRGHIRDNWKNAH